MARFPYILELQSVLAANGTGTVAYTIPQGESLEINELIFDASGAFAITDIHNSNGKHYTNATTSTPIKSTQIQNGANANLGIRRFIEPLIIPGGDTFYVDLKDTSGSGNTVNLALNGVRVDGT